MLCCVLVLPEVANHLIRQRHNTEDKGGGCRVRAGVRKETVVVVGRWETRQNKETSWGRVRVGMARQGETGRRGALGDGGVSGWMGGEWVDGRGVSGWMGG